MKTYVITLSKIFLSTHPRHGELTMFKEKFLDRSNPSCVGKIHTMRSNFSRWERIIGEVQCGEAQLSIRQWSAKPYHSKQEIVATLTKEDGVGIQKLEFIPDADGNTMWNRYAIDGHHVAVPSLETLANNDGLSLEDWKAWFKGAKFDKPLAIIHFTGFRY